MAEAKDTRLQLLVFGAGAIGGYLGGCLALSGHRVVFLERTHNAPALRQNGLRITQDGRTQTLEHVEVVTSIQEALVSAPYDAALFALKSYDTAEAMEIVAPFVEQVPPFLCLQNGVDNEGTLADVLGSDKVIAGTVTIAVRKPAPGQLIVERKGGLGLAANHPLSDRLVNAMGAAGLNARLYPSADEMKWSKMLANLLTNASCAVLDMSPAEIFADPRLFELEMRALREALAVMDAFGLRVVDLPGVPVRALAFAASKLPLGLARLLMARAVGRGRGGKMPSMHIDLHASKGKSEVGWLNGAVMRWGEEAGLATPVNQALNDALHGLLSGEVKKVSVGDLLGRVK